MITKFYTPETLPKSLDPVDAASTVLLYFINHKNPTAIQINHSIIANKDLHTIEHLRKVAQDAVEEAGLSLDNAQLEETFSHNEITDQLLHTLKVTF